MTRSPAQIFVAYPYAFPKDDYHRAFAEAGREFQVTFRYADQRITNRHILDKITDLIEGARFSLFDVTRWNPNVALELGFAIGRGCDYYLLFNPDDPLNPKTGDVPADLGGIDRIHYRSYSQLSESVRDLLDQECAEYRIGIDGGDVKLTHAEMLWLQGVSQGLQGGRLRNHLMVGLRRRDMSSAQVARIALTTQEKLAAQSVPQAVTEAVRRGLL